MLLATAQQMRRADELTINEIGLKGMILMENAAQGAVKVLEDDLGDLVGLDVAAFCGRGNNGGDGFAMLRIMACRGASATAYLFCSQEDLKGDAAMNCAVAKACGVALIEIKDDDSLDAHYEEMARHELYIDALLGTGLNSAVRGRYQEAILLLNGLDAPVLSVDIPSGLSADTGKPLGLCVEATWTATFGLAKLGLALDSGAYVGDLTVVDISIPPQVLAGLGINSHLLGGLEAALLLPERPKDAHKGTFGHLMVLGGSPGKTGACCLSAWGGIRAGAGLVTALIPKDLNPILEVKLTGAMTQPLPQTSEQTLSTDAMPTLLKLAESANSFVVGPGLSTHEDTQQAIRDFMAKVKKPVVLDADGLNAMAGHLSPSAFLSDQVVLTPHPGEAARLLGITTQEVQMDRPSCVRRLALESGCVVVLKGARSLIADPSGDMWVNPTGNPILASGGSGDVLSGVIAGFMAQGLSPLDSACLGVYLHGLAADLAVDEFGERGMAAEELVDYLQAAFSELDKLLQEEPCE